MENTKNTSLLISGFIGGIAFIIGCSDSSQNTAFAREVQEQLSCRATELQDFASDEIEDVYRSLSTFDPGVIMGSSESRGSGGVYTNTRTKGVICYSLYDGTEQAFQPLVNFTSNGWVLEQFNGGSLTLNKYSN